MRKILLSLFMLIALPTFALADNHGKMFMVGDIEISHPQARPTMGGMNTTAAFMMIKNKGTEDDRLIDVKGDVAKALELHTHIKDGDIMKMRRVEGGFIIPASGMHALKPGSDHVMVMGMHKGAAVGDMIPMTLVFEKAGEVEIMVPVVKIDAKSMGHSMQH